MLDFDDMLVHVGEFGIYQKFLFVLQAPLCVFTTFVLFGHLFLTLSPAVYWCEDAFNCTNGLIPNILTPVQRYGREIFDIYYVTLGLITCRSYFAITHFLTNEGKYLILRQAYSLRISQTDANVSMLHGCELSMLSPVQMQMIADWANT